jgi:heterodisulfide reductase subunit C
MASIGTSAYVKVGERPIHLTKNYYGGVIMQLEATIALVLGLVVIFSVPVGVWIIVGRGLFDTMYGTLHLKRRLAPGGFLKEICSLPGAETVRACIQCGTCTGSCPAANEMQFSPRAINAMVKAGMRDEVLSSNSMWLCLSCYLCAERCPKGVKVTDIMYALKRLAIRHNGENYWDPTPVLERTFVDCVNLTGRLFEVGLTGGYYWRTNPVKALTMIPMGVKLLSHHRLPLMPSRVKRVQELRSMIKKAQALEREQLMEPVPVTVPAA